MTIAMTPRRKTLAALALLLTLFACAHSRPGWVSEPPESPGFASAVGVATDKASLEEARQAARAAALAELTARFGLSAQLTYTETNTAAGPVTGRQTTNRSVEERLDTASPKVRIEAPEVAARHEERTPEGRWDAYVLLRYPLSNIKRERERLAAEEGAGRLAAAMAAAHAKAALARGAVGEALDLFGQALAPEADPAVRQQAEAELRRVASGLTLEARPVPERAATLSGLAEPIGFRAMFNGLPASGVALSFRLAAGEGEIEDFARTDEAGLARCRVSRLEAAPRYAVSAAAELPSFGGMPLDGPRAEASFRLKAVPWRVFIDIGEESLGQPQPHSVVAAALAEKLAAAGIALAARREGAEVIVTGRAATREGSDNLGWKQAAVADVRVRAVLAGEGPQNDRLLVERSLSLADFSDSVELAGLRALQKAGAEAARAIIGALLAASP